MSRICGENRLFPWCYPSILLGVCLGCGGATDSSRSDGDPRSVGAPDQPTASASGGLEGEPDAPLSSGGMSSTGGTSSAAGADAVGGSTTEPEPLAPVVEYCEEACLLASDAAPESCAEFRACPDELGLSSECEEDAVDWNVEARQAFLWCIENDPLCFVSTDGCVLHKMLDGSEVSVRITASGFDDYEGMTWTLRSLDASLSGMVEGGKFSFEFQRVVPYDFPVSTLVWIDVNNSGSCDPGVDALFARSAEWNGSFDDPRWEGEMTPLHKGGLTEQACANWE